MSALRRKKPTPYRHRIGDADYIGRRTAGSDRARKGRLRRREGSIAQSI